MTHHRRTTVTVLLLALAAALGLGSRLLTAGAEAPASPPAATDASPSAQTEVTPLPDFKPTEELPADAAVAFPTDI